MKLSDDEFLNYYEFLNIYYSEYGSINVSGMESDDAKTVYNCVLFFREKYKNDELTSDQINMLKELNFDFGNSLKSSKDDSFFEVCFKLATEYHEKHGDLLIPESYKAEYNGKIYNVGLWIRNLRARNRKGKVSQDKIDRLNSIGMIWNVIGFKKSVPEKASVTRKGAEVAFVPSESIDVVDKEEVMADSTEESEVSNLQILSDLDRNLSHKLSSLKEENKKKEQLIETILRKQKEIEEAERLSAELDAKLIQIMSEAQDEIRR